MKKTLVTVLVLSLIVALSACGALATTQQNQTTPTTAVTQPETKQPEAQATVAAAQPVQQQTQPATEPAQQQTQPETKPAQQETQPPAPATTPPTQPATKKAISRDRAIEIALQAAGLTKEAVFDLEAELDKERNGLYWEVSFETTKKEYDYDIHAYDGTVAKVETEKENAKPVATEPVKPGVSRDQAVELALKAAGLKKADVAELEAELDEERRVVVWEVSFETRTTEYSYEINANDGKIVKSESERND